MNNFPVFVINLDRSPERYTHMCNLLKSNDLPHERIAAVDGALLHYESSSQDRPMGRELTSGEIGCYLSHIKAVKAFLATGAAIGVVFEDDLSPHGQSFSTLDATLTELQQLPLGSWHLVNIGQMPHHETTKIASLENTSLVHAHYFPITTAALIWSRAGAEVFIDTLAEIQLPVDVALQSWLCRTGLGLACSPEIFSQIGDESQLDVVQPRKKQTRDWNYQIKRLLRQWVNRRFAQKHRKSLEKKG